MYTKLIYVMIRIQGHALLCAFVALSMMLIPQPVSAQVIFYADFEDGIGVNDPAQWVPENPAQQWRIDNFPGSGKGLFNIQEGCGISGNTPLPGVTDFTDGVIQLNMSWGDDDSWGVVFRKTAPKKGYIVVFGYIETPYVIVALLDKGCADVGLCLDQSACENNPANTLIQVPHGLGTGLTQNRSVSYTGRIEAKGDTIRVWFLPTAAIADPLGDLGAPIVEIQDGTHTGPGAVGIWHESMSNSMIDNVLVWLLRNPAAAGIPSPEDGAEDVARDVALGWDPGQFAKTHDVYFGTVFNDVNEASRTNPRGVLVSQNQSPNSYSPATVLRWEQTYYWRVDEVNAPPDFTIFKGEVWSFTVEPIAYPIAGANITATASSQFNENTKPENTINGSGLDENDLHSTEQTDIWLSSMTGPQPTWIQYEFDKVYKLHQMLVWNHNTSLEPVLGFGFKDVTIEYSTNGTDWTVLTGVPQFARAPGAPRYANNTTVDLGGVPAKYVKLTANSNWGGIIPQYGLSEVRFFYVPVSAREPNPASGAADTSVDAVLSWRAGREAAKHNVYFSDSNQAVINETISAVSIPAGSSYVNYGPLSLDLGKAYYWKINEVNEAKTPAIWQGDVWNFSAQEYLVVDDFEDYNDFQPDRIFDTWIDGWGVPTNGSQVGYATPPFAEKTIVHSGKQSMPLSYDNSTTASYSEATANVANLKVGRDWTKYGIKTLSLWFRGDPNNAAERMYVKLNGSKVAYTGNAANLALMSWQLWNIDLTSFVGVNLRNVTEIKIGFERSGAVGGKGKVYFDDIRLYRSAPAPVNEWRIAAGNDDAEEKVVARSMDLGSSDLELGYEGAMAPAALQIVGCRWVGIPVPKGATITEAWVQFSADAVGSDFHIPNVSLIIEGELSANPATFSSSAGNISSRPKTTAKVVWDIPRWMTVHAKGPQERTADISPIIQEIVNQNGWAGSAIVLMFRDNPAKPSRGCREAESFNGDAAEAPLLHITYR